MPTYPVLVRWLHRHGIVRTVQSSCRTADSSVRYLIEARWWTPHWLLVWAAQQHFRHSYDTMASTMHLARVEPEPVAVDGTQRWVLHWHPTAR